MNFYNIILEVAGRAASRIYQVYHTLHIDLVVWHHTDIRHSYSMRSRNYSGRMRIGTR